MKYVWETLEPRQIILDSSISLLFFIGIMIFFLYFVRRFAPILLTILFTGGIVTGYVLNLHLVLYFSLILLFVTIGTSIIANIDNIKDYVANFRAKHKGKIQNINDLVAILTDTVASLSASKIGAIITIERSTAIEPFCRNGVQVNAPVSKELLETIFYKGTRLHDGAVIIKNNVIKTAAVFFPASTKQYVVKYGARHRAAIGISDISDSVSIVVSEETGRISIAQNGRLEVIDIREFSKILTISLTD